jgi:hypothetical protein
MPVDGSVTARVLVGAINTMAAARNGENLNIRFWPFFIAGHCPRAKESVSSMSMEG